MYRLLIVDDEKHVVDWLFGLFSMVRDPELEIRRAGSGVEALRILEETDIDVILSDYKMPGMSGLDLLDRVNESWSDRRLIILSGYAEFDYIYQANAHGAVRYLLKTEEDEKIVEAVLEALREIERARANLRQPEGVPSMDAILAQVARSDAIRRHMENPGAPAAKFPLAADADVLPVLGTCLADPTEMPAAYSDAAGSLRLAYALEVLTERYFSAYARCAVMSAEAGTFLWLFQDIDRPARSRLPRISAPLLSQRLENFQIICDRNLGLSFSFVMSSLLVPWSEAMHAMRVLAQRIPRDCQVQDCRLVHFSPESNEEAALGADALADKIRRYVEANLGGDLTLTNISRQVYYNPSYISRIFKQETGTNLTDHIVEKRLARAVRLLETGDANIYRIAESCGFDSPQYFATVFKKRLGKTPQEFRDAYRDARGESSKEILHL